MQRRGTGGECWLVRSGIGVSDSGQGSGLTASFFRPFGAGFPYSLPTHGLRPFGRLRASCGLHSFAASRLGLSGATEVAASLRPFIRWVLVESNVRLRYG